MSEKAEQTTGAPVAEDAVTAAVSVELAHKALLGRNWLWAIALFSGVSLLAQVSDFGFRMLVGLGAPLVAAVLAGGAGAAAAVISGLVAAVFLIGFVLLAWAASTGKRWAFLVGGVIYALDALLLVLLADWLAVIFHGFALWYVLQAWLAMGKAGPGIASIMTVEARAIGGNMGNMQTPSGSRVIKIIAIAVGSSVVILALILVGAFLLAGS